VTILGLRWDNSVPPGKFEDVVMLHQANRDEARAIEQTEDGH
jgi:hypothetical protein